MVDLNPYLLEFTHKSDVTPDSYIIYDMGLKKIYGVKRDNFYTFSNIHCIKQSNLHYTMDLAFARTHSLMFDIDIKGRCSNEEFLIYINDILKPTISSIFHEVTSFTVIECLRDNGGLHVHFPEFIINHDDYILLCTKLQYKLNFKDDVKSITLDIPINFNLPFCSKPNGKCYFPYNIDYFENGSVIQLPICDENKFKTFHLLAKRTFKRKKCNVHTIFREILELRYNQAKLNIYTYLMPVVSKNNLIRISYNTFIDNRERPHYQSIAHFNLKGEKIHYILKAFDLSMSPKNLNENKAYQFIVNRRKSIADLQTANYAIIEWYKNCNAYVNVRKDIFQEVNELLIEDNDYFMKDAHPIKTIMEFDDGYYFLPVFYALRTHLNVSTQQLVAELRAVLTKHDLVDKLDKINDTIIQTVSKDFTLKTILYCGSNLVAKSENFGDMLKNVIEQSKSCLETCMSPENIQLVIERIIERYIPVMVAAIKNSCKKPMKLIWNIVKEQWQEFNSDNELKCIIINIVSRIKEVIADGDIKVICALVKDVQISSKILSEMNMNRVHIVMDVHKWHLKTKAGVLDLLTGHVGGIVPEFYISELHMGVEFSRRELLDIRVDEKLIRVYETLTSKRFFRAFLKNLFLDVTDNFFDTLTLTAREFDICEENNKFITSMFHFYVHICKYMAFEYDLLMYMVDILSSLLIGTNYSRHFYILQGITGNGKSKFFEILTKLFNGYSQQIRNVNLQSGKVLTAQPELATGLFSKRIVAVEEMHGNIDENLIKELTGNSFTSFRRLYENNDGGIPSAKLMASTNKPPICVASEAFEARVITIPFHSKFKNKIQNSRTSTQVTNNQYPLETTGDIVNQSYEGLFIIIYLHLSAHIDLKDGFLHLRGEPEIVVEFKKEYMNMTSIYMLFKQYADVQIVQGAMTTLNDLLSAVRQFLKEYKRADNNDDKKILREFNEEFKSFIKQGVQDGLYTVSTFNYSDDEQTEYNDESDEPPTKKANLVTFEYYDGIIIKNMKKVRG